MGMLEPIKAQMTWKFIILLLFNVCSATNGSN